MRRAVLAAGLALVAHAAFAAPPLDKAAFTREAASRLSRLLGEDVAVSGPLGLTYGDGQHVSLARIHAFCVANTAECEHELDVFLGGITDASRARLDAVDSRQIRIIVRDRAYAEAIAEQSPGGVPARPIGDSLAALLVIDAPTFVRSLSDSDLAATSLEADTAFTTAMANAVDAEGPLSEHVALPGPGEVGGIELGYFSSSRLLPHGDWAALAGRMRGPLLAMVPEPGVLLYVDGADAEAVASMRGEAQALARRSPRPLPLRVLRWTPTGWVDHTD